MNRYGAMFKALEKRGEAAFGAFAMLGDPDIEASAALCSAMADAGADMLELGIPFSDPVADGPVIQAASERALAAGVRTGDCLSMIARIREVHTELPIGVLTYANIVAARGIGGFCKALAEAGADSLLIADVPAREAAPYAAAASRAGIALVMIAAPNTSETSLETIAKLSGGYTYCVARAGVTGTGTAPRIEHGALIGTLARLGAPPPVLGFGISAPDHVRAAIGAGAKGIISGSALVDRFARTGSIDAVVALVRELKTATTGK